MFKSRRLLKIGKPAHMAERLAGINSQGAGWLDMVSGMCFQIIWEGGCEGAAGLAGWALGCWDWVVGPQGPIIPFSLGVPDRHPP